MRDKSISLRVPKIVDDYLIRRCKKLKLSKSEYILISLCKSLGIEYVSEQFTIPKSKVPSYSCLNCGFSHHDFFEVFDKKTGKCKNCGFGVKK